MIKRSSSLSDIEQNYQHRSGKPTPSRKLTAKLYRGRSSLAKGGNKNMTRKSKGAAYDLYYDPDDVHRTSTVHEKKSTYLCLPVLRREQSSSSDGRTSTDTYDSVQAPVQDARQVIHEQLQALVCKSDKTSKIKKQDKEGKEVIIIDGHKYCDVVWLELNAFIAGRPLYCARPGMVDQDTHVMKARTKYAKIVNKILNFTVTVPFQNVTLNLVPVYMVHLADVRQRVYTLLEDLEQFQSLFPSFRAMIAYLSENSNAESVSVFVERVEVLNAWFNTVDDLDEKILQFRQLFEIDETKKWPSKIGLNNNRGQQGCVCVQNARSVFTDYVKKSLNLEGMKKILRRVLSIASITFIKVTLLLHERPHTYAEAVSRRKAYLLNDEEIKRYDSEGVYTTKFGPSNEAFIKMQLPSYAPLFKFLVNIPMELVLEWLTVRSGDTLNDENKNDVLTLKALMVDCKDCVEEAVKIKRQYLAIAKSTGNLLPKQYSIDFDLQLKSVFTNYLKYLTQWSRAVSEEYLDNLWPVLEEEWQAAFQISRSISSGVEYQSSYFLSLISSLLETLVVDYWENAKDGTQDYYDPDSNDLEVGGETFHTCREYNRIIRKVHERTNRIGNLLRTVLGDLQNATGYELLGNLNDIIPLIESDHVLVESKCSSMAVTIFVDKTTAMEPSAVGELLAALCEGRKWKSATEGYALILPDEESKIRDAWSYKRIKVIDRDDETSFSLSHLRTDLVCSMGNFELNKTKLNNILQLSKQFCSTNENIETHINDVYEKFLQMITKLRLLIVEVRQELEVESSEYHYQAQSTMRQAFNVLFQLHRDAHRMIFESGMLKQQQELVQESLEVITSWYDLVKNMKFNNIRSQTDPSRQYIVPVWALSALNFFLLFCEKSTALLSKDDLEKFANTSYNCTELFMKTHEPPENSNGNIHRQKFYKHSEGGHERKRFKVACEELDARIAAKYESSLGKEVEVTKGSEVKFDEVSETKWRLLPKIGSGASADVYKAIAIKDMSLIAVKKIRLAAIDKEAVHNEIKILRSVNHVNLVKLYDPQVFSSNGEVFIALEYYPETLGNYLGGNRLDSHLARGFTNGLLKAVAYLHQNKIVHRDIKPDNIFISRCSQLKLGDFGCSIFLSSQTTTFGELKLLVGTPAYMAPEVVNFGRTSDGQIPGYGRAIDIWSVGCVVLHMVTGEVPWKSCNNFQIQYMLGNGKSPPIKNGVSDLERKFLMDCFVVDPKKRKSARTLLQETYANIHVDLTTVYSNGINNSLE